MTPQKTNSALALFICAILSLFFTSCSSINSEAKQHLKSYVDFKNLNSKGEAYVLTDSKVIYSNDSEGVVVMSIKLESIGGEEIDGSYIYVAKGNTAWEYITGKDLKDRMDNYDGDDIDDYMCRFWGERAVKHGRAVER